MATWTQMTEAERFRKQAERALRLAHGTPAEEMNRTLQMAAAHYLGRAVELEQAANQQQQLQPKDDGAVLNPRPLSSINQAVILNPHGGNYSIPAILGGASWIMALPHPRQGGMRVRPASGAAPRWSC
jgi:hypothetical protein